MFKFFKVKEIKDCGCRGKCSCERNKLYEAVKKRYNLSESWPYWAIPSKLIKEELKIWLQEILSEK